MRMLYPRRPFAPMHVVVWVSCYPVLALARLVWRSVRRSSSGSDVNFHPLAVTRCLRSCVLETNTTAPGRQRAAVAAEAGSVRMLSGE